MIGEEFPFFTAAVAAEADGGGDESFFDVSVALVAFSDWESLIFVGRTPDAVWFLDCDPLAV